MRLSNQLDIHLMIIDNNTIYGVEISDNQKTLDSSFYEFARPSKLENKKYFSDKRAHPYSTYVRRQWRGSDKTVRVIYLDVVPINLLIDF